MVDPVNDLPDHAMCPHCGKPISWDDYCYTHDDTAFADCGIILTRKSDGERVYVNPPPGVLVEIEVSGGGETFAEPPKVEM